MMSAAAGASRVNGHYVGSRISHILAISENDSFFGSFLV